ncbi:hypothetical protein CPAR01_03593 [Colletotrichum paranaense]|uniref:Uncharacterized protein n=1 Tax=Colletotrichum paranaense TaxID=1914294 RepID=A0ABQ9SUH2_9PEZI|nr:uncharacterized protein CPAR01_03593 [Colletotrichum paranaense]KAK1542960.1 hypothetical protein CPAR01_03593 [Colletotrichum paranaense]
MPSGRQKTSSYVRASTANFYPPPLLPPAHYACRVEDHCFRLAGNQGRRCKKPARISGDVNLYD